MSKIAHNSFMSTQLSFELLENRITPSIEVRFDLTFDVEGYFTADKIAVLNRAADEVTSQIGDSLTPIFTSEGNTWAARTRNGATGQLVEIPNLAVAADEVVVFLTSGNLPGNALALAASGAYTATGSQAWLDTIQTRGQVGALNGTDISIWGGMVAFNSTINWNTSSSAPTTNQFDMQSVATHELMHIFGFGLDNPSFDRFISNGFYNGPQATTVYSSAIPMEPGENDHFAHEVRYNGRSSVMAGHLQIGEQKRMTELEFAVLRDIGWNTPNSGNASQVANDLNSSATTPTVTSPVQPAFFDRIAIGTGEGIGGMVSGFNGAAQQVFSAGVSTGFASGVRTATGDLNGDGTDDFVVGTGPGGPATVVAYDGRTGTPMFQVQPFESAFVGGVYVAVGDMTGDGRADIAVGAGAGGGPRVKLYNGATGELLADFWGIADPDFRGGVRLSIGDLNGDGIGDLVAAAGEGGGPRVAGYDGRTVRGYGTPSRLFNDFFVFEPSLTNGAFVAIGDINGDGIGDLITGAGPGGGPRVTVFNGQSLLQNQYIWLTNFFAGEQNNTGGVRVAAADLDNDGFDDLITGSGAGGDGYVRAYAGSLLAAGNPTPNMGIYQPAWATAGVYVG